MGPLAGVKVIEIAGLGAAPYGCMMLADMGADVVRIDRTDGRGGTPENSPLSRNRRSIALDLKKSTNRDLLLTLITAVQVDQRGAGRRGGPCDPSTPAAQPRYPPQAGCRRPAAQRRRPAGAQTVSADAYRQPTFRKA